MNKILKYQLAKIQVLDRIASLDLGPGDQLPTQEQLLAGGGFSQICLIRALSELESEGLIRQQQGRRAVLCKPLERIRYQGNVLFLEICRSSLQISAGFYTIQDALRRRSICARPLAVFRDKCAEDLTGYCKDCMGIIVCGWITQEWLDYLRIYGLPLLVVGSNPFPEEVAGVDFDWYGAARSVCRKMHERGCRRLAYVNSTLSHYVPSQRIECAVLDDIAETGTELFRISDVDSFRKKDVSQSNAMFVPVRDLLAQHDRFDGVFFEKGYFDPVMINAVDLGLPGRLCFGSVLSEKPLQYAPPFSRMIFNYFPDNVFRKTADFFLSRLTAGKADQVDHLILKAAF
ncbi:MAG: GntR family transcriptional regulator [Lentisphaeria bacterium]|nr:GntR family transcriptional regulator [Lentisphaeria bacterium]